MASDLEAERAAAAKKYADIKKAKKEAKKASAAEKAKKSKGKKGKTAKLPPLPKGSFTFPALGVSISYSKSKKGTEVIRIDPGSPADGKLQLGDVISKIEGKEWSDRNTRNRVWAASLDIAESEKKKGQLELELKSGKKVILQIKALGDYSPTAPYDCKKTDAIFHQLAKYLMGKAGTGPKAKAVLGGHMKAGLLGLMATGEEKYQQYAFEQIKNHKMAKMGEQDMKAALDGSNASGDIGWSWGYNLITLGEYFLLTGDKSVLPSMKWQALTLAKGQDAAGMWGHRLAIATRKNRIPGYGAMNQPTITNLLGLMFAKKCGIENPDIDNAIDKTYSYVSSFVGRGGFGYGTGSSSQQFNNNGTSGSAAMVMHLGGNKEGVSFFSKGCATSHQNLNQGHASSFFNPLWTPLGANLAGPEVTQGFFKKSMSFHNLKRKWNGGYGTNGTEGPEAGYALLMYALPRRALIITGREMDRSLWLKGEEAQNALSLSSMSMQSKSDEELMALMEHPLPQIGARAATTLTERDVTAIAPKMLAIIKSPKASIRAKKTALDLFRRQKRETKESELPLIEYADELGAIVKDPKQPLQVRAYAGIALGWGGYQEAAYPYWEDILKLHFEEMPTDEMPGSTRTDIAFAHAKICNVPFQTKGLKFDPQNVYKASKILMRHKKQNCRGIGTKILTGLPEKDFKLIAEALDDVLKDDDPSYHTYGNAFAVMNPGINIFVELKIKEGMDRMLSMMDATGGKGSFKIRTILDLLPKYGAHAIPYLPKFEESPNIYPSSQRPTRFAFQWDVVSKAIREDKNPPKIRTLAEVMAIKD